MYCSSAFKTFDWETVFVSVDTGAASKVVASNQKTIDQATRESAEPIKLSNSLIGDQLKTFLKRRPINPPTALPAPMQINNVAALSAVLVSEVVVAAPEKISIKDLPSQAPKINPIREKTLTNSPRRQPETKMKMANPIKIRSRYNGFNLLLLCLALVLVIQQLPTHPTE